MISWDLSAKSKNSFKLSTNGSRRVGSNHRTGLESWIQKISLKIYGKIHRQGQFFTKTNSRSQQPDPIETLSGDH